MTKEIECSGLERSVVLEIAKEPKKISDISKSIGKSIQVVSKIVERMEKQDLVQRKANYLKDARVFQISLNKRRVTIARTHSFYLRYFLICSIAFMASVIVYYLFREPLILVGATISIFPPLIYMFYSVYVAEDKVIVYKTPKIENKKKENKDVDNVDEIVDNS